MTKSDHHDQAAPVPERRKRSRTQPAADVRSRWRWTEGSVGTDRMLTTLEQGVKGGKWFRLIDKVYSEACLHSAARQVLGNKGKPGVDHVSVEDFAARVMPESRKLSEALLAGAYRPQAIRRVQIPKPGSNETRPLGPVALNKADGPGPRCTNGAGQGDRADLRTGVCRAE